MHQQNDKQPGTLHLTFIACLSLYVSDEFSFSVCVRVCMYKCVQVCLCLFASPAGCQHSSQETGSQEQGGDGDVIVLGQRMKSSVLRGTGLAHVPSQEPDNKNQPETRGY